MCKNTIGELKLQPMKDDNHFVFINDVIKMNGKINKGDHIKIKIAEYHVEQGQYILTENSDPIAEIIVRGKPVVFQIDKPYRVIDELYNAVTDFYRKRYYFGTQS